MNLSVLFIFRGVPALKLLEVGVPISYITTIFLIIFWFTLLNILISHILLLFCRCLFIIIVSYSYLIHYFEVSILKTIYLLQLCKSENFKSKRNCYIQIDKQCREKLCIFCKKNFWSTHAFECKFCIIQK